MAMLTLILAMGLTSGDRAVPPYLLRIGETYRVQPWQAACPDLYTLQRWRTYAQANDDVGKAKYSDQVKGLEPGTRVRLIKVYDYLSIDEGFFCRVRILDGRHAGRECYVSGTLLEDAPPEPDPKDVLLSAVVAELRRRPEHKDRPQPILEELARTRISRVEAAHRNAVAQIRAKQATLPAVTYANYAPRAYREAVARIGRDYQLPAAVVRRIIGPAPMLTGQGGRSGHRR